MRTERTILMTGLLMLLANTVHAGAVLTGDTVKLGTASVTAKRSIVKMDVGKLTYNVEADPDGARHAAQGAHGDG